MCKNIKSDNKKCEKMQQKEKIIDNDNNNNKGENIFHFFLYTFSY